MDEYNILMEIGGKINPCSVGYHSGINLENVCGGYRLDRSRIHSIIMYYRKNDNLYNFFEKMQKHHKCWTVEENFGYECSFCDHWEAKLKSSCQAIKIKVGFLTIRPKLIWDPKREGGIENHWQDQFGKFESEMRNLIKDEKFITAVWQYEFKGKTGGVPHGTHVHCVFEYNSDNEKTLYNIFTKRNNKAMKEIAKEFDIRGGVNIKFYTHRFYFKDKIQYMRGATVNAEKNLEKLVDIEIREEFGIQELFTKNVTINLTDH